MPLNHCSEHISNILIHELNCVCWYLPSVFLHKSTCDQSIRSFFFYNVEISFIIHPGAHLHQIWWIASTFGWRAQVSAITQLLTTCSFYVLDSPYIPASQQAAITASAFIAFSSTSVEASLSDEQQDLIHPILFYIVQNTTTKIWEPHLECPGRRLFVLRNALNNLCLTRNITHLYPFDHFLLLPLPAHTPPAVNQL